jgi:hypothetical protein
MTRRLTLLLASLFLSPVAMAGPTAGTYTGGLARVCVAAKPKAKVFSTDARALRDNGNGATEIRCSASAGADDSVNILIKQLPNKKVRVTITGVVKSRTTGRRIPFSASGVGNGKDITGVSLSTRIADGRLGPVKATIDGFALSSNLTNGKTQLYVEVGIYPKAAHPLGQYTAAFKGTIPTPVP